MKSTTSIRIRTTTEVGEHFVECLESLDRAEPSEYQIPVEDMTAVRRCVDRLRGDAVQTGYIGRSGGRH